MSLSHEFYTGTDLSFLSSSSRNQSKVLFPSSRSVQLSALPERALLHRDQIPNTPVTLCPPKKYETKHRKDNLTRISGDAAFNRDDVAGCRASNDDRLPVVELHPFTRKEWRPSNSIHVSSSSSSNSLSSSASVASSNILLNRTMTSGEIAKGEKKKKEKGKSFAMELGLPRQKTNTTLTQVSTADKTDDLQLLLKNKSAVTGVSRDCTFLLPQPSTFHPTTDLTPRVIPNRSPTTAKPGPHAIRRETTTTASGPVRNRNRITLTGTSLSLTSRSSTFTNDSDRRDVSTTRDSGKTSKDYAMILSSSLENHQSHPEVIYHRSRTTTLDPMAVLPVRLRPQRTMNVESSYYHKGPTSGYHIGVTKSRDLLNQQGTRPIGFESQLASLLRVTLAEMRRTQPSLSHVNDLPSGFRSYKDLVQSTYGEDRIRSGMKHNARNPSDAKVKRIGFTGGRKRNHHRPPQGPTRNYTLPNLFGFLEDDTERDSETETERQRQRDSATDRERQRDEESEAVKSTNEGISDGKMTYNSRRTSPCSSRTSGSSGAGVVMETDVVIETAPPEKNLPSTGIESRNSVLSSLSSQSENVKGKTENLRLTNQNEEESMETVATKTEHVATVPIATTPTINSSLETETMETHLGIVGGDSIVKKESEIERQMVAEHEIQLTERYTADESASKPVLEVKAELRKSLDESEEKLSKEMEPIV